MKLLDTIKKAPWQIAQKDFYFGGKRVAGGSIFKQFESKNFGWVVWREWLPGIPFTVSNLHLARN